MKISLAPHVTETRTENGESVLLDRRNGRYWQLNASGSEILSLLLRASDIAEATAELRNRHPKAADRIPGDVQALLTSLRTSRLVQS
ncbi:lasso peptide biosynthesis PqqD family chaperone [Streptomyces sp. NPDC058239]|uniref:lasso peptide biosynthesis PqqD family chaperone n=1 Tax=Streptomyces sp. NPDC058239 TaxID=3346395 RepID=UPI0036EBA822